MNYPMRSFGLLVSDVKGTVPFYRDLLSYPLLTDKSHFALFSTQGPPFFLWRWSHVLEHLGVKAMAHVNHRCMGAIRYNTVGEVDRAYEELVARGAKFVAGPKDWPWNARAAYFVDPEGYIWELYAWLSPDEDRLYIAED